MANFTQNDTNDFPSGSTESQSTCPDRYHNGIANGESTEVSFIFVIIINSIGCVCTTTLNVLVIVAVKRIPRLQSNTNILLACLAGTDLFCGVAVQPSLVVWKVFQVSGTPNNCLLRGIHNDLLGYQSLVSVLHLSLVTGERLIAIKYTMRYPTVVTVRNIRLVVIATWVLSTLIEILGNVVNGLPEYFASLVAFILMSCILFIVFSYAILFGEIRRHQKLIKTQQLPQGEIDRHVRDYKAFKTTVYIVSAVLFSFLPMAMALLFRPKKGYGGLYDVFLPWFRTFAMLNSLLNPLIYCCRQKEMRDYIMAMFSQAINPQNVICLACNLEHQGSKTFIKIARFHKSIRHDQTVKIKFVLDLYEVIVGQYKRFYRV